MDIFASLYDGIIGFAFNGRAAEPTPSYHILCGYNQMHPDAFSLIGGLHQNGPEDKLHLSLAVQLGTYDVTVHIYGFWKNRFIATHMTMKMGDKIDTIARFSYYA